MKSRTGISAYILTFFVIMAMFCSCGSKDEIPPAQAQKLRELGDVLVSDLQKEILPRRENPETLAERGYVFYNSEKSYGVDTLAEFYGDYGRGDDCAVTLVFSDKAFVVARIIFEGDTGYYFRYEYDTFNPDSLAVSGQLIDSVDLRYQTMPEKWEFALVKDKAEQIVFTLRNPQPVVIEAD